MYRKNVAGQFIYFQLNKLTDGTGLTGATVAVRRCIDGTFAAGGGTVTEDTGGGSSAGFYKYAMAQADTNGNNIGLAFTATGAIAVEKTFITTAADPTDGVRLGLTSLPNAAAAGVAGLPVLDANSLVDADVKRINAVATTSVTAVNANQGTTQPVNFTGTAGSALVKSDMVDVAGAAVSTTAAQIGVNAVNIGGQAAALDANNFLKVDVEAVNAVLAAAQNVGDANQAIGRGTCAAGGSTTSIPTSAWNLGGAGVVSGQFIGRTIIFDANTTTAALRGQATNITGNTAGATPTFVGSALTTPPAIGDTFMVV